MSKFDSYQKLIESEESHANKVAEMIISDPDIFNTAIQNLLVKNYTIRFNNFDAFLLVSENHPELVYPHWDFFEKLLLSKATFQQYIGIHIIANLTQHDPEKKFEKIEEQFLELVKDKSIVTVNHVIRALAKIINNKPDLREKLIDFLFTVEKLRQDAKHKDLTLAYVIEAFQETYKFGIKKEEILGFVLAQRESSSPKTRKAVQSFLDSLN